MKVTYTTSEAVSALTKNLTPLFGQVTIEIVPNPDIVGAAIARVHPLEAYANMIYIYGEARLGSEKINSIKFLRNEIMGLGLADAKYIVEADPVTVLKFYHCTKTMNGFNIRR